MRDVCCDRSRLGPAAMELTLTLALTLTLTMILTLTLTLTLTWTMISLKDMWDDRKGKVRWGMKQFTSFMLIPQHLLALLRFCIVSELPRLCCIQTNADLRQVFGRQDFHIGHGAQ